MLQLQFLEELVASGLSLVPIVPGTKQPAISEWKSLQTSYPSPEELESWSRLHFGIAIVCGKISGSIEIIDVDTKNDKSNTLWPELQARLKLAGLWDGLCIQNTPSGGKHIIYRTTAEVPGNHKIAINAQKLCIIETRGEAGYFACYPTPEYSMHTGSLTNLPTIDAEKREELMVVCRSFNEQVPEAKVPKDQVLTRNESKPGDDYNARCTRADFQNLLTVHGWKVAFEKEGIVYLTRPGKEVREGVSASLFYGGRMLFHCFTSNAPQFDPDKSYDPFGVYARLEHNGDFRSAAMALKGQGYAKPAEGEIDDIRVYDDPAMQYLNDNYRFRYNEVLGRYYYAENETPNAWKLWGKRDLNTMYLRIKGAKIKGGKEHVETVIESEFTESHNPFLYWYYNLPPHDGVDYISRLAKTITLANDKATFFFTSWLTKWLVAHVAQMETGMANHTALVLKGGQGVGKTTWLNKLCPPELAEYLYCGPIKRDDKDMQIVLAERFLINLDELETMHRIEIGSLKSFMTTDKITIRRPYDRHADVLRRWASFVGSVNKSRFLTDETGNRRFLVTEALGIDHRHGIEIKRVWAQAKDMYLSGYQYWFDADEIAIVNDNNDNYRKRSLPEELVEEYILAEKPGLTPIHQTATQIVEWLSTHSRLKINATNAFIQELGAALQAAGFKPTKQNGRSGYKIIYADKEQLTGLQWDSKLPSEMDDNKF